MKRTMLIWGLALGFMTVALGFAPGQDDKEDALLRQRDIIETFDRFEDIVRKAADRLDAKEPENAKKLREAWQAMRAQLIKEDMADVAKKIEAGNYRSALQTLDTVKKKLSEILKILLGSEKTTEEGKVGDVTEYRKDMEKALSEELKNKQDLDRLKAELNPELARLQADIKKTEARQAQNRDKATRAAGDDLIALLKHILARLGEIRSGLNQGTKSDVQKKISDLHPSMNRALEMIHVVAKRFGHDFLRAVNSVKHAGADLEKDMKPSATGHIREAEDIVRKILAEMENRTKDAATAQKEQDQIGNKIGDMGKQVEGMISKQPASNQKAREALKQAQKKLSDAKKASDSAENKMKSNPGEAAKDMQEAQDDLAEASDAVEQAEIASESNMTPQQKQRLADIQKREQANAQRAKQAATKAPNPAQQEAAQQAAQEMQDAASDMQQAAAQQSQQQQQQGGQQKPQKQQGGKQQPQQGQQQQQGSQQEPPPPQNGESSPLDEASDSQQDAIEQMEDAVETARSQEMKQLLNDLASKLARMIEEQMKINSTTAKLDKIKKDTGDLSRQEKIDLRDTGGKQKELSDQAAALRKIAEKAEAQSISGYMGVVSQDMETISKLLGESKTDRVTQRLQDDVLAMLQALLRAVRDATAQKNQMAKGEKGEKGQKGEKGEPGEKGDKGDEGEQPEREEALPPETEIRLLIEIQKQIRRQTQDVGQEIRGVAVLSEIQKDVMKGLNKRQGVLIERMEGVIGRIHVSESMENEQRER